ncbi:DUF4926 domain-containing protein, partial [Microcoleus sp. MON2_D5]|uniref:DUF4926 domain-containing protein n=1 Tax=Microcoleus sp. MON2_D5 TaxID=2818833 RepID=UPI002FD2A4F7
LSFLCAVLISMVNFPLDICAKLRCTRYDDGNYEVEFSDRSGETIALCTLSTEQFLVVWKSKERRWLSVSELLAAMVGRLSDERQIQVLELARSLSQKESVFGGF